MDQISPIRPEKFVTSAPADILNPIGLGMPGLFGLTDYVSGKLGFNPAPQKDIASLITGKTAQAEKLASPSSLLKNELSGAGLYTEARPQTTAGKLIGDIGREAIPSLIFGPEMAALSGITSGPGAYLGRENAAAFGLSPEKGETLGAVLGGLAPVVASAAGKVGEGLKSLASKSELESLGITKADLGKTLKTGAGRTEFAETGATSLENAVDSTRPSGITFKNPADQINLAKSQIADVNSQLNQIIDGVDSGLGGQAVFVPEFNNAQSYVNTLKGTVRESLQKKLDSEVNALMGGDLNGSLRSVQEAKQAYNELGYSSLSSTEENLLNRKIAQDLKETVESGVDGLAKSGAVPSEWAGKVKELNQTQGDYYELMPFFLKKQLEESTQGVGRTLTKYLRTSGAPTLGPLIAGSVAGHPGLGLATSVAGGLLTTTKGRQLTAIGSRALGGALENVGNLGKVNPGAILPLLDQQGGDVSQDPTKLNSITPIGVPDVVSAVRKPVTDSGFSSHPSEPVLDGIPLSQVLDGIRQVESSGGKHLVSPAGALGPYQFMPATAKDLGLKDPMDEVASREAAGRYILQLYKQTGNLQDALAAYNFGIGNVLKGKARPKETLQYPDKVLAAIAALNGVG